MRKPDNAHPSEGCTWHYTKSEKAAVSSPTAMIIIEPMIVTMAS